MYCFMQQARKRTDAAGILHAGRRHLGTCRCTGVETVSSSSLYHTVSAQPECFLLQLPALPLFHWDAVSAARAGLLHDLYFYETADYDRSDSPNQKSHSAHHPEVAMQNAAVRFALNPRERDMIEKHMWPLTHRMPHYKESYAITFVDKYAAMLEFFGLGARHMLARFRRKPSANTV